MSFLLHFLRSEDMFIDIGANVGSYTILASAHIGAESISFEPHPATFQRLIDNIRINNILDKVVPYNEGLGNSETQLFFTDKLDTANYISEKENTDTIKVNVRKLDSKISSLENTTLLKMDVEGYEKFVIEGGISIFKNENLKAMIVELNSASEKYGYKSSELHNIILELGFASFSYEPFKRKLIQIDSPGNYNTIYIRDINFVSERVQNAEKIKILNNIY
jgi:FkbM family methyltransferase